MLQAIKQRTSIRNYEKGPLSKDDLSFVMDTLHEANEKVGPFGHKARFFYTENKKESGGKYGTYGFIKNPPAFIGGVIKNTKEALVDFGFLFEEIILKLTTRNLGTVWLGGTFNRNEFNVDVSDSEIIAAISPVGYPKDRSLREKAIRTFINANKRIDFDELFFDGEDQKQIKENHPYHKYLEAVQMGPSASNKQPWRVILQEDMLHFFLKRTPGYGNLLKFDIQAIDIGIALSHMTLTLTEDDYKMTYIDSNPFDVNDLEYIISIQIIAPPKNR